MPTLSTAPRATILLVDDDQILLDLLTQTFEPHYRVVSANSGDKALAALALQHVDLVITG